MLKFESVAKVGEISVTANELQRAYSNLFNQYNQLFQGKLDEKQAQQFGLKKQAMQQLVHQASIMHKDSRQSISVQTRSFARPLFYQLPQLIHCLENKKGLTPNKSKPFGLLTID